MDQLFGLQHRSRTDPVIPDPVIPHFGGKVSTLFPYFQIITCFFGKPFSMKTITPQKTFVGDAAIYLTALY